MNFLLRLFTNKERPKAVKLFPVLSIIFEKSLKNGITPHLEENRTQFQTGGVKSKGVVDNLFILRGMIDHSKCLGKELWITFYDIEKCFDSLWLEDCISSLWRCGVKYDISYLVFQLNMKAMITVRTPFGNTEPFQINNIVNPILDGVRDTPIMDGEGQKVPQFNSAIWCLIAIKLGRSRV